MGLFNHTVHFETRSNRDGHIGRPTLISSGYRVTGEERDLADTR